MLPYTTSPPPNLVSQTDISATAAGSPQRALLEWFEAVQFRDLAAVHGLTAPESVTRVALPALDQQIDRVGVALAHPQLVSARANSTTAVIRALLVTYDPQVRKGSFSFPWTFRLLRSGGRWLVADVSVLFPGGKLPPRSGASSSSPAHP